jgi:hypothetical protein
MTELDTSVDSGHWLDLWRRPDGDEVLLPTNGAEVYARQAGWTLLAPRAFDRRVQMQADAKAYRWRGTTLDVSPCVTGPVAVFPAA